MAYIKVKLHKFSYVDKINLFKTYGLSYEKGSTENSNIKDIIFYKINYEVAGMAPKSSNVVFAVNDEKLTLNFVKTRESYPRNVLVTGATIKSWNRDTGELILKDITDDITICSRIEHYEDFYILISNTLDFANIVTSLTSDGISPFIPASVIQTNSSISCQAIKVIEDILLSMSNPNMVSAHPASLMRANPNISVSHETEIISYDSDIAQVVYEAYVKAAVENFKSYDGTKVYGGLGSDLIMFNMVPTGIIYGTDVYFKISDEIRFNTSIIAEASAINTRLNIFGGIYSESEMDVVDTIFDTTIITQNNFDNENEAYSLNVCSAKVQLIGAQNLFENESEAIQSSAIFMKLLSNVDFDNNPGSFNTVLSSENIIEALASENEFCVLHPAYLIDYQGKYLSELDPESMYNLSSV